jgi:molybdopterin-containing oxidoreductase family membrane subunit
MHSFEYLFHGIDGHAKLVPFMWTSAVLGIISVALLIPSSTRNNEKILVPTLVILIIATWIDKGLGLVAGGFIPNPMEHVTEYFPTLPELMITLGVYATGALVLTILYKVAVSVKEEKAT